MRLLSGAPILALLFATPLYAQNIQPVSSDAFKRQTLVVPMWKDKPLTGDIAFNAYERGYYLTALSEALKRVEKDKDPLAMTLLGEIYQNGYGVVQNNTFATSWFKAAAERGERNALFSYGMILLKDNQFEEGLKYLNLAAQKNHLSALYNLGLYYFNNDDATQDFVKAATYFEQAAKAGEMNAQYAFAQLLFNGKGRDPNVALGNHYLKAAAEQGLIEAEIDYAIALLNGKGMAINDKLGAKYMKKAALSGNPVAQNRYARLLATGKGVAINVKEATKWHTLASLHGVKDTWLDAMVSRLDESDRKALTFQAIQWYKLSQY